MSTISPSSEAGGFVLSALSPNEFSTVLEKEFKPKSDSAKAAVEAAVETLAAQLMVEEITVSDDSMKTVEALIAAIDRKISTQLNEVLHHDEFRQLEGAWRGFHYLVSNTETDEMLKIRLLNISKAELHKTLKKFKGTNWDQSQSSSVCTKKNMASSVANPTAA